MNRKIPEDAFGYYLSLGAGRSYEAVAQKYKVSKKAVTNAAAREEWQKRIEKIEREARERTDQQAVETLEQTNARHLKVLRFIQNKAIETLKSMPIGTAMEAVRAYSLTLEKERLIIGEPSGRTQVSIEEITRREIQELLVVEGNSGHDRRGEPAHR